MNKDAKKDYINILVLIILFFLILFSMIGFNYVNGSTVDWDSQHVVIPDYFRKLFYDTKDLFPSFAFNLGSGENIYNLSYYGLLSPFILFSYLLPNVSMINYIQIVMVLVVIVSIILMYYWLRKRFNSKYSFLGTLLFLLAAPLIYHTHRHIMFIIYMPFLIMGLMGVDRYFDKNKRTLLVISVFLIIMSSYYYSVGSILCLIVYGIYRYIELNNRITFDSFIKDGFKFLFPIIVGIIMSFVLILPTFYALMSGRSDITQSINIFNTFIPKINLSQILYNSYTIGVTSVLIFAIVFGLNSMKKENKFLALVFLSFIIFPFITYLLSGFMYLRGKVLIPFLPLSIYFITTSLNSLNTKKNVKFIVLFFIFTIIEIVVHIYNKEYMYIFDVLLLFITYIVYMKRGNKNIILYPLCIASFICCLINNYTEKYVSKEDILKQYDTSNYDVLLPLLDKDENLYRAGNNLLGMKGVNIIPSITYYSPSIYSSLENVNYQNFVVNETGSELTDRISTSITPTRNILLNSYLGIKYLIDDNAPIGYEKIDNSDVYVNNNVYPVAYSTSNIMSYSVYDELPYPDKIEALFKNIIVNEEVDSAFKSNFVLENIEYEIEKENVMISYEDDMYVINSDDNGNININLNKKYNNKLLLISFDMEYSETCLIGDTYIEINGVKNVLSCKGWTYHNKNYNFQYVISSNEVIDNLFVEFAKGKYVISNISVYSIDYNIFINSVNNVDVFNFDKDLTKGDVIVGDINVTENGYFKISIPYEEKGFSIYVDEKLIEYEKVDTAFIGFPINEGHHNIKIVYTSPYLSVGLTMSICGFMIFLPIIYSDLAKEKKKKKKNGS